MAKRLLKTFKNPHHRLFIDDATGIAWVEDTSAGISHSAHPNISATGSVRGMRDRGYWGRKDRVVRSHGWYYNIDHLVCSDPLDEVAARACQCEAHRECRTGR